MSLQMFYIFAAELVCIEQLIEACSRREYESNVQRLGSQKTLDQRRYIKVITQHNV